MEGKPFGRYRLIELLGQGGMGEVWRAFDTEIDRVVALKMLLAQLSEDPEFEQRFRREVRAAARLENPHVVPIYDVGEIDGRLYVTMRLITGTDLQTMLDKGPLDPRRAVAIIDQIAAALHNAHEKGLVHRDVKPSNILLDERDFAYLIDFGIARTAEDKVTKTGAAIGTWAYMAPERFNSDQIHPSSDIYALACVLYELLTGEEPFPGTTLERVASGHIFVPPPRPSEVSRTVPTALDGVIAKGLAKQPEQRYRTAIEMASAAKQVIANASTPTPMPPLPPPPRAPQPPHPSVMQSGPHSQVRTNQPWTQGPPPAQPMYAPQHPNTPLPYPQTVPPAPKRPGRNRGALIGALVFITALVVAVGIIGVAAFTSRDDSGSSESSTTSASGGDFTGTFTADYGPGTDLEGNPVPNAPATTSNWAVRSTCGASGCVATAANIDETGGALLSNMTFDLMGGNWVAVGLASAQCGDAAADLWVVFTLRPESDGTFTGETVRASADGACSAKRTVKFTRTGDPDSNKVPDPGVLPPRTATSAQGLWGSYRQTTRFAGGNVTSGKVLTANTYCLRTGDRCLSLFHAADGAVTLIFADGKWTRNEQGTATCPGGGTARVTITAEYPEPTQMDDPISVLTGRGQQTVNDGGDCAGGGDFTDQFERTGD